jgi:hypothetical protein
MNERAGRRGTRIEPLVQARSQRSPDWAKQNPGLPDRRTRVSPELKEDYKLV